MPPRQSLRSIPQLWLVSDLRTDAGLEPALRRLPRGAGLVFRHYHLPPAERAARFRQLARLCRHRGLVMVWAGTPAAARRVGADGVYGAAGQLTRGAAMLRLVTVHSLRELGAARRSRADLVLISPVFPTRTHPGAPTLGPLRWLTLARHSPVRPIALGGMTAARARRLPGHGWAAIDGLADHPRRTGKSPGNPKDS